MPPLAMLPPSILARSCAAIACIRCSVWAPVCRFSCLVSPANLHDAPFARRLLEWAVFFYPIHPRVIRLDAAYWGLRLIAWIHATLHAVAVIPWNPKRQKNRSCLPPTWTKDELGKRSSIERFFGRVFLFFHEAPATPVWLVGYRAAGRPDLHRLHHRRPRRSAGGSSRFDPLS